MGLKQIVNEFVGFDPEDEACGIAIRKSSFDGSWIGYIKNPSEELQLLALDEWCEEEIHHVLYWIKNPTLNVILKVIDKAGLGPVQAVDFSNRKDDLRFLIEKDPSTVCYIRDVPKDLQLFAIRKSGYNMDVISSCEDYMDFEQEIMDNLIIKDIIE